MATRIRRALIVGLLALLGGLALTGSALAKSGTSTDWRVSFDSNIDFGANIFASFNTPPYFIFTEVYDQLINPAIGTGIPDPKNSPTNTWEISPDGTV